MILTRRLQYFFCAAGLILISFGVALTTKAGLGTSPISSIPYTLSLILPGLSMGTWLILFSIALVLIEIILLKGKMPAKSWISQLLISFPVGWLIDAAMWLLTPFNPEVYLVKVLTVILGCVIIALGAYLCVSASLLVLPGDGFVQVLAQVTGKSFGGVRVISDTTQILIAAVLCLIFLHALVGVREGTIIAAILVGSIVKIFARILPITRAI
ncbi:MAG: YitT family protein [Methanocorpusculum sp.]|nr:YitT family protein [Methanocorpusculum sp.]